MDAFWSKVNKSGGIPAIRPYLGECWIWVGARSKAGYGQIRVGGVALYSHRLVLSLVGRDIPDGFQVDHLCRNRACCNPDHLEAVTARANMRRAFDDTRKSCPKGHPYDEKNTIWKRGVHRECRRCKYIQNYAREKSRKLSPEKMQKERERKRKVAARRHQRLKDDPAYKAKAVERARLWRIKKNKQSQGE